MSEYMEYKFMHFARFPFDDRMFFKIKWFIEFI